MSTRTATEFLTRSFQPGETIAVLLRKENPASTTQGIVRLEQALAPRYLAWLRYENHNGANVYVAANPLRSGSRTRTKDCIAEVRHLYIDIDVDGEERIAALRASDVVPTPSAILSTSPGKYQALWRVEGFDFDRQENTLKLLVIAFGGDSACTDRNRVLRVPGFLNRKYKPAHPVSVEYPSDSTYHPDNFRLNDALLNAAMPFRDTARTYATGKNAHSEHDWAWAVQQLSPGEDAANLTLELASRRSDKPNPLYYAQRTIDIASALPQESQAEAFEQCWRKDWQDKEPHLLPAKHVAAWIQANLYLSLADAPFDREDPTLNPTAGACVTCPRRSGHNTSLFCDVQGDQCLDSACYHGKVEAFLDREIAAHPGLVQIENGWRNPKEQRTGAVQRGHVRELPTVTDNPDAKPVMSCAAAQTAIVVYGKQLGRKLTVCTDKHCPVHDPRAAAELASNPIPKMEPAKPAETEEEAAARQADFELSQNECEEERQRNEQQRREQFERQQAEYEAEQTRRAELLKARQATFERVLENAPPMFIAAQLRVLLRALVNLDPYTFADDLYQGIAGDNENDQRSAEEVLLSTIDATADDKLTRFALRLSLAGHVSVPRDGEFDFLSEATSVFASQPPNKKATAKPAKPPRPVTSPAKAVPKAKMQRTTSSKKLAA